VVALLNELGRNFGQQRTIRDIEEHCTSIYSRPYAILCIINNRNVNSFISGLDKTTAHKWIFSVRMVDTELSHQAHDLSSLLVKTWSKWCYAKSGPKFSRVIASAQLLGYSRQSLDSMLIHQLKSPSWFWSIDWFVLVCESIVTIS